MKNDVLDRAREGVGVRSGTTQSNRTQPPGFYALIKGGGGDYHWYVLGTEMFGDWYAFLEQPCLKKHGWGD